MPIISERCKNIRKHYKIQCKEMEKLSNIASFSSFTYDFLPKLLVIAKKDIDIDEGIIESYKTLMEHTEQCSNRRLQFLNECIVSGENDQVHADIITQTKEIHLEMKESFSRLEKVIKSTEAQEVSAFEWLNDSPLTTETDEEKEIRRERRRIHEQRLSTFHRLRAATERDNDTRLEQMRRYMTGFGSFFVDNFDTKKVCISGNERILVNFKGTYNTAFTLKQIEDVVTYSRLHSEIFYQFIAMMTFITANPNLGVNIQSCIDILEKVSKKKYLVNILRCPSCVQVLDSILLSDQSDQMLDNLDHLARIDPYLFSILAKKSNKPVIRNHEKNISQILHLITFMAIDQNTENFSFSMGVLSKFLTGYVKKNGRALTLDEFNAVFINAMKTANSIIENNMDRSSITIPMVLPTQRVVNVYDNLSDEYDRGIVVECFIDEVEGDDRYIVKFPVRYKTTIESSSYIYIPSISSSVVVEDNVVKNHIPLDIHEKGVIMTSRKKFSINYSKRHYSKYTIEYI